jgi:hypothetical protein
MRDGAQAEVAKARHGRVVPVPANDLQLLLALGIVDQDLEQKAVELRHGQRVGALLLDGVLRCDHHEGIAERIVLAVDGDGALVHRLKQRGLRLGRGAVDLVGKQDLGEDRALGQHEAVGLEIEQVGAQHVARHQVGRELDAPELQRKGRGEGLGEERLGRPRHALDEDMAADKQAGQHQVHHLVLADHGLADLAADALSEAVYMLKVHQGSPVSIDISGGRRRWTWPCRRGRGRRSPRRQALRSRCSHA